MPCCPKNGNKHCIDDFPECEGKNQRCSQMLQLLNLRENPINLYFEYYLTKDSRDGRIKKRNSTLLLLINNYHLDENLLVSA
jgi:hypothetical protein